MKEEQNTEQGSFFEPADTIKMTENVKLSSILAFPGSCHQGKEKTKNHAKNDHKMGQKSGRNQRKNGGQKEIHF